MRGFARVCKIYIMPVEWGYWTCFVCNLHCFEWRHDNNLTGAVPSNIKQFHRRCRHLGRPETTDGSAYYHLVFWKALELPRQYVSKYQRLCYLPPMFFSSQAKKLPWIFTMFFCSSRSFQTSNICCLHVVFGGYAVSAMSALAARQQGLCSNRRKYSFRPCSRQTV